MHRPPRNAMIAIINNASQNFQWNVLEDLQMLSEDIRALRTDRRNMKEAFANSSAARVGPDSKKAAGIYDLDEMYMKGYQDSKQHSVEQDLNGSFQPNCLVHIYVVPSYISFCSPNKWTAGCAYFSNTRRENDL